MFIYVSGEITKFSLNNNNNIIRLGPKFHFCIYVFNTHCVMKNALEMKLRVATASTSNS